jgi:hypothetical protein
MAHELQPRSTSASFIPGIFNYCDRWCARCPFSERCGIYDGRQGEGGPSDHDEATIEVTSQIVQRGLEEALLLLQRAGRELGVSIEPDDDEEAEREQERRRRAVVRHPLAGLAKQYTSLVCHWLRTESAPLRARLERLRTSGHPPEDLLEILAEVEEHLTVIEHDVSLIGMKVSRAVSGALLRRSLRVLDARDAGRDDEVQNDENGSAKVALLSIDRSIEAWIGLARHHPDALGTTAALCEWLERLRAAVEAHFPHARKFRRPGFDARTTGGTRA